MHARRVLLIGGGGFIGRALGRRLAASGCEVHALSRHVEPGRRGDVEFHRGSQAETAVVAPLLARCDSVVHLASTTTPGRSAHAPALEMRENLEPLADFLELLAAAAPRRILYLSSGGAIYGNPPFLPATEEHPVQPLSWHAAGKVAAEEFLRTHARQISGTSLAILRPANVYGPGQPLQAGFGFVRTLMEKARSGEPVEIWGDGRQVRDFLYIDDLVDACLRLLDVILVQRIDRPQLTKQVFAQFETVVDRCRLRQIEQRSREEKILGAEIDATDQVGFVFALGQQPGLGARCAALGEHEHRRATSIGLEPCIGMDRQE